eukprot:ANDGO_03093.mRNA.1 Glyoxysomal processing protease
MNADYIRIGCTVVTEGPDPYGSKLLGQPFYTRNGQVSQLSTSGIVLSEDTVLCLDSIVVPFVDSYSSDTCKLFPGCHVRILLQGIDKYFHAHHISFVHVSAIDVMISSIIHGSPSGLSLGWPALRMARQIGTVQRHKLGLCEKSIQMTDAFGVDAASSASSRTVFAVLKLSESIPSSHSGPVCGDVKIPVDRPRIGAQIVAASSPFGVVCTSALSHSVSCGHVANYVHSVACANRQHPTLALVDCRLLPGSEGAPLFCCHSGQLVGMILHPIRHDAAGIEFHIALIFDAPTVSMLPESIVSLLERLSAVRAETRSIDRPLRLDTAVCESLSAGFSGRLVDKIRRTCVDIHAGSSWGSGVLLSSLGYIVTNAHVVRDGGPKSEPSSSGVNHSSFSSWIVKVRFYADDGVHGDNQVFTPWIDARVVYVCSGSVDVALLHVSAVPTSTIAVLPESDVCILSSESEPAISIAFSNRVSTGSAVCAVGFGLFGLNPAFPAGFSRGCISKILTTSSLCCIGYQTDCVIHQGNSGGPLFLLQDPKCGQPGKVLWIGLIRNQGRRSDGSRIPRLNFAMSTDLLDCVIQFVRSAAVIQRTQLMSPLIAENLLAKLLAAIEVPNDFITHVSNLSQEPSSRYQGPSNGPRSKL